MIKTGDEHFMVDETVLEKICGYADLKKTDYVFEVGAGTGNLTRLLSRGAGRVFAVEKNKEIFEEFQRNIGGCGNVMLLCADATKIDFPDCNKVASNLPYSISRRITRMFIEHGFESAVLVYQKEFSEKLVAKAGGDHYRMITALVQSTCEIELLDDVSPEAFAPQPNVWSRIIRLRMKWKPPFEYVQLLNELFNHKNKKIRNILKDAPSGYEDRKPCEMTPEELKLFYTAVAGR